MTLRVTPPVELAAAHAVRFYRDADALAQIVANTFIRGLQAGHPCLVVAIPDHTALVVRQLQLRGFDPERLRRRGDLVVRDANQELLRFMVDGTPNSTLFFAAMEPLIELIARERPECVVHVYGEMVDVLWKRGDTQAAIQLEILWNDLARRRAFSLLCGYAMGNFYKDADKHTICSHHTHHDLTTPRTLRPT